MASDPAELPHSQPVQKLPRVPLAGTRGQAMQRVQIGLFGLGSMVLLIGLTSLVLTNARQNEAQVVPEAAPTVAVEKSTQSASDPLADAGIVPELSAKQPPLVTPPPPPDAGSAAP